MIASDLKKSFLNYKARSFHIKCKSVYSTSLYEYCQLCTWGPYRQGSRVSLSILKLTLMSKSLRFGLLFSFKSVYKRYKKR